MLIRQTDFANLVKILPTPLEKIEAVSPWERPWTQYERQWHRPWMAPLLSPRRPYRLYVPPTAYNLLPFYKFVTNTHTIEGLPPCYDSISISEQLPLFEKYVLEVLAVELDRRHMVLASGSDSGIPQGISNSNLAVLSVLDQILSGSCVLFSDQFEHLKFPQASYSDPTLNPKTMRTRLTGDNRYKDGHLAFSFHDCARFEYGDPFEFGLLTAGSFSSVYHQLHQWNAEPEEFDDCLLSSALMIGFTQYTDLTYALASQTVLTDLQYWYFGAYQLNTMDLIRTWQEENDEGNGGIRCNVCWHTGPLKLYESFDGVRFEGVNKQVLEILLKYILSRPAAADDTVELRPYVQQSAVDVEKYRPIDSFPV
ncbi:unnamed protein product [Soboliphyme baturini]|uniref:RdRp n=1 Tax=Soboliphyme baturini TaxID=241478 RepID=A0A183IDE6_9BILA|nr:unnamed protein product [Soboliphyme baturini]